MRVLDRYLVGSFLWALLHCVVLLLVLFVVIDAFNNLDEFLRHSIPPHIIASYYLYYMPAVLVLLIPIATLVSLLFILGNFSKHNEIMALKASGVSTFHILTPYLFIGVLISFGVFLINENLVPKALLTSTSIKEGLIEKGRKNLQERAIKNVTWVGKNNRMIFAREYEMMTQTLHDVVILEGGPNQPVKSKLTAEKAEYQDGRWMLREVMSYRLDHRGDMIGEPTFDKNRDLELSESPEEFVRDASQVEYMSIKQLRVYMDNLRGSSDRMMRRLAVDFHYKLSLPFISLVLILIGAPLAMRKNHSGVMVGIGTSFVIALLYYATFSVSLAMGKGGLLSPLLAAWLANALFLSVGIYLIRKAG